MIETGLVVEVKNRLVTVRLDPGKHCFGCMNLECKDKEGFLNAANPLDLPLEKGQMVRLDVKTSSLAVQGLQAALPPVLGFAAGFAGAGLFPALGEGPRILCGIFLLAAAAAGFYLFRKKHPAGTASKITALIYPCMPHLPQAE